MVARGEEVDCLAEGCFLLRERDWEGTWGVEAAEDVDGVDAVAAAVASAGPHDHVDAMGEAVKLDPYPESCALLGEPVVEPTQ